jgi:protein phosphatase
MPAAETGAATHVGKVRRVNEDCHIALPDLGVWVVADGIGGHDDGQLASRTVIEFIATVGQSVSAGDLLARVEDRIIRANDRLRRISRERRIVTGTTVAALLVHSRFYACVWAGDSRIYLLRNGALHPLTRDHSEAQELLDKGILTAEEAENWPRRNVITRAIGIQDEPELEIEQGLVQPGDAFVVCSDGLTKHLSDQEIAALAGEGSAQEACAALVAKTLERGATDNVTVILVRDHTATADVAYDAASTSESASGQD